MTPLIDRYLQNVRLSLPATRRDDIVRELAEDIRTQVADREAELGRDLTETEQDALLKKFGHPLALATRYGPQRHVIGPALFPVYWMTLKIALGGALAVNAALDLNLPRLLDHAWADMKGLVLPPAEGKGRRWTLIAEIVGSTAFLIWWLAIPRSPFLVLGPTTAFLALAPIWQQI